ncbi:MAG: hypothetical protein Q7K43_03015, partial [Candidatus Woesearchaeota archaeon]|nr:hypothetical protein [Candidatus Woesearchaeota archaeon]
RMYDTVFILAELIKNCGRDNHCMLKHLQQDTFQGTSEQIRFDDNGDIQEELVLYEVKNRTFVQTN